MQGVLAVITCVSFNFAPKNWALCNGQILPIALNQALFSLLGTTYGGNGTTTFALPNLQGRVPVGWGAGPGLSSIELGQAGGSIATTLNLGNLPSHAHVGGNISVALDCDSNTGSEQAPDGFYIAANTNSFNANAVGSIRMKDQNLSATIGMAGGSQPLPLNPPYLAINYIICLAGIFPSRS